MAVSRLGRYFVSCEEDLVNLSGDPNDCFRKMSNGARVLACPYEGSTNLRGPRQNVVTALLNRTLSTVGLSHVTV